MGIPNNTSDRFRSQYGDSQQAGGVDWPATRVVAVTPSDGADLPFVGRALWIGGAGTIVLDAAESGTAVSFTVAAGTTLAVRAKRVRSTGTTATNIVLMD